MFKIFKNLTSYSVLFIFSVVMLTTPLKATDVNPATSNHTHGENKDFKPAILYNFGGKEDQSFGTAAYRGIEKFKKEFGIDYKEFEITNESQREQAIRKLARSNDHVICIAFGFITPLNNVAPEFPNVKFSIIDAKVDQPNVESIEFKEHEGSFLVGMLAAMASKSNKVGFIGGMDSPLIRKFELGYIEGANYINSNIEVYRNMTGTTPKAWNDPTKGGELAKSQIDRGADVVYAAAGGTGLGVYQAVTDMGALAIGVDSNQNYLHPGHMLTSMVKRVDVAVYETLVNSLNNKFEPGHKSLGLAEAGVDYALDQYNSDLVTEEMREKVEKAKAKIISGELKVTDYTKENIN